MRVILIKSTGRGTTVKPLEYDETGPVPMEGILKRYRRFERDRDRQPAREITEALRRGGHLCFESDHGVKVFTSTIREITWATPENPVTVVETLNSCYQVRVLKSSETPTGPHSKVRT